ncbi:hypothetical protein [Pelagibius sp. Alg239-R121]|uniref:hypothetical protein n=1 Tax=Pelagibius sp. Alg239-R121 TaxID=2993448 RepID=UPI0024A75EEB|nr:hypothetical protein [Pelagibius sp. Alg239-R121]
MTQIVEIIRKQLSESALPPVHLEKAEEGLVTVVEKDSLGALIASAIASKNQGRIDEAISNVTKANRQQLDAIEGITKTLDEVFDRPANEVVFAKFRQISPFEMGVEGADDVLDLVRRFQREMLLADSSQIERLHELESEQTEEFEALAFFRERFSDGSAKADVEEIETKLKSIADELERTKTVILSSVIMAVCDFMSERQLSKTSLPAHYDVAGWLYQIVTSKVLTKPASEVLVV